MELFLKGLREVTGSPLAFVAYVVVAVAWAGLLWKESRIKNITKALHLVPESDRPIVLREHGLVPRGGLSAEQFLRLEKRKYYFLGVGMVALLALILGTLALYRYIQLDRVNVASETLRIAFETFIRGTTTADDNRFKEGVAKLEESVRISPSYAGYQNLADIYEEVGQVDKALWASAKAAELDPANPSPRNLMGSLLKDQGRLKEALLEMQKAQALFDLQKVKDDEFQVTLYVNTGNVYYEIADAAKDAGEKEKNARAALRTCYEPALRLRGGIKNERFLANLLGNAANAHRLLREYEQAEKLMFESITLKETIANASPEWKSLGIGYFNLSDVYLKQGQLDKAQRYLDLSQPIFVKAQYSLGLGSVSLAEATIARQQGQLPKAREYAELARKHFSRANAALYETKAVDFLREVGN